jgi:hypothetical protein
VLFDSRNKQLSQAHTREVQLRGFQKGMGDFILGEDRQPTVPDIGSGVRDLIEFNRARGLGWDYAETLQRETFMGDLDDFERSTPAVRDADIRSMISGFENLLGDAA